MKSLVARITIPWERGEKRQIAVNLKPGITALTGPSGGGKSSFARCLLGLEAPLSGRISLNNSTLYDADQRINIPVKRRKFAAVTQRPALFPGMSVRQNIAFGATMRQPGLGDLIRALELGPILESKARHLSGGQAARTAIARSLASLPDFLVLDEPTAGLDRRRRVRLIHLLRSVLADWKIPVLYITHHTDEILSLAEQVMLMDDGKLISSAPPEEFFRQQESYDHLGTDDAGVVITGHVAAKSDNLLEVKAAEGVRLLISDHGETTGSRLALRILEADVALAKQRVNDISVLNQLPGRVSEIRNMRGDVSVEIALGSAPDSPRLRARVTKTSARALGLVIGTRVWALIKAVAIRTYD